MLNIRNVIKESAMKVNTCKLPNMTIDTKKRYRYGFFKFVREHGYNTEPSNAYEAAADFLTEWCGFIGNPSFNKKYAPPDKGLFITGSTGTGKTVLVNMIREYTVYKNNTFGLNFTYIRSKDIVRIVEERNRGVYKWYDDEIRNNPLIIDDIGSEEISTIYGSPYGIANLIEERYDEMRKSFYRGGSYLASRPTYTIVTSNLDSGEISKRYGGRIASRCNEMFKSVLCTWPTDRRVS